MQTKRDIIYCSKSDITSGSINFGPIVNGVDLTGLALDEGWNVLKNLGFIKKWKREEAICLPKESELIKTENVSGVSFLTFKYNGNTIELDVELTNDDLEVVKYGLAHKDTNELLTYSISHNDNAEYSVDDTYTLSTFNLDNIWLVDEQETANKARISTQWYNANYESPAHNFQNDELKVVKVRFVIEDI